MPEIHYKQLSDYLYAATDDSQPSNFSSIYLIHGEEFLCKTAFKTLLTALVPDGISSVNYEPVSSSESDVAEAVQKIVTYSLVPGRKVVSVLDSHLFHSRQDAGKILEAGRKAFDNDNFKNAARHILKLMALLEITFEDLGRLGRDHVLSRELGPDSENRWLESVIGYCREKGLTIPGHQDNIQVLTAALEKGFPKDNHLILTTDIVDKRRKLFKLISQKGSVIDCSVPRGNRKADRLAQESVLSERMSSILKNAGKSAEPGVFQALVEMTGFDLRTFVQNLEKLINYAGQQAVITGTDLQSVLKRSKKDPLYEFTNAVTDRNLDRSIFFMASLLKGSDIGHPLQLLAALTNQIRKLLVVKTFVEGEKGGVWYTGCPYNIFQSKVMPAIVSHDNELVRQVRHWRSQEVPNDRLPTKGKKKKPRKSGIPTDLIIAKSPKNAYPVYQMFKKSERFTTGELVGFMHDLTRTDQLVKTSGRNPGLLLEKMVFSICIS